MAVSTVSSLGEAFTAGAPLHLEDVAPAGEAEKTGASASPLPPIAEEPQGLEATAEDTPAKEEGEEAKPEVQEETKEKETKEGAQNGDAGEEGDDDDEDGDDDDGILQVHA